MAFLGKRKAKFLAYPKDGDDTGIELPIIQDDEEQLVADFFANPANKTAELAIYPEQIGGKLNLIFSFDSSQDFMTLYVRVRPLSDINETEKPLLDIPIMYDPDEAEDEKISIPLPDVPVVIFLMLSEQLNMGHGKNRLVLTTI